LREIPDQPVPVPINRDKWRDQLLANGPRVFDNGGVDKNTEKLLSEITKLKILLNVFVQ